MSPNVTSLIFLVCLTASPSFQSMGEAETGLGGSPPQSAPPSSEEARSQATSRFFGWFGTRANKISIDLSQILDPKDGGQGDGGLRFTLLKRFNPFQYWRRGRQADQRREKCRSLGGTWVLRNCLQYFGISESRDFFQARKFCNVRGGDLWVPNLRDQRLFQILSGTMPKITGAIGESVWAGARNSRSRITTIAGEDVTNAFSRELEEGAIKNQECLVLEPLTDRFRVVGKDCGSGEQEFVCEYPVYV